jgi:hypothetical protein
MEYPTLITTMTAFGQPAGVRYLEGTTVHEFGHQYFYGMVATNEFEEAWLDEGINEYVSGLAMGHIYRVGAEELGFLGIDRGYFYGEHEHYAHRPDYDPLETFAWRFAPQVYGESYHKTASALRTLEGYLGHDRMLAALGEYARKWRFRHPHAQDFFAAIQEATGEDLYWFFGPAFLGTDVLDYEVSDVDSIRQRAPLGLFDRDGKRVEVKAEDRAATAAGAGAETFDSSVLVHRKGGFRFPVELAVTFDDGRTERVRWDGQDRWKRFAFTGGGRAQAATVDPDGTIPLDVDWLNNGMRAQADRAPAQRMRWGFAFSLQTLLQLVGL